MIKIATPAHLANEKLGEDFYHAVKKCQSMSDYEKLCAEFEAKSSRKLASWHMLGIDQMRRQIREAKRK